MTQVARSWRVYGVIFRGKRLPRRRDSSTRCLNKDNRPRREPSFRQSRSTMERVQGVLIQRLRMELSSSAIALSSGQSWRPAGSKRVSFIGRSLSTSQNLKTAA